MLEWLGEEGASRIGRTDYLGVVGWCDTLPARCGRYAGAFTNRSKTRLASIGDGSSKSLLLGEAQAAWDDTGTIYELSYSWMGAGSLVTSPGLAPKGSGGRPDRFQFSSEHGDIVQFCFADGSVQGLVKDIDWDVFIALSGIDDGKHIPAY